MAIQLRRGQEADFDESKLAQGEVAITVDTDEMFYKGSSVKKVQEALEFDSTPTTNSTNPVTSEGIKSAIDSVSSEASSVSSKVGDLADLQTTAKTDVVAAINEIDGEVESLGGEIDGKVGTSVPSDAGKVSIIYPSSDDDPLYVYRGTGGGWSRITAYTEFGASPTIARAYSSTKTYNTGDYVRKNRQIFRCLEDNVTGAWDSTKWTVVVLADEFASEVSSLKDNLSKIICSNLMGNEANKLYPVFIPAGSKITISTSDGSVFPTDNTLQILLKNSDGVQTDYFGLKTGTSYRTVTVNASRGDVYYLSWNETPSVPLMVNVGDVTLPYVEYFTSANYEIPELRSDVDYIESVISRNTSDDDWAIGTISNGSYVSNTKRIADRTYIPVIEGTMISSAALDYNVVYYDQNLTYISDTGWTSKLVITSVTSGIDYVRIVGRVNDSYAFTESDIETYRGTFNVASNLPDLITEEISGATEYCFNSRNIMGLDSSTYYPVEIKQGTKMTMSTADGEALGQSNLNLQIYDNDRNYIGYWNFTASSASRTITISNDAYYLKWNKDPVKAVQVEVGSAKTEYTPYALNITNTRVIKGALNSTDYLLPSDALEQSFNSAYHTGATDFATKCTQFSSLMYGDTIEAVTAPTDCESFLFFTDPHLLMWSGWEQECYEFIAQIQKYYNSTPTTFCLCGGDWLGNDDLPSTACYKMGYIDGFMHSMFDNVYMLVGNHDTNYQGKLTSESARFTTRLSNQSIVDLWYRKQKKAYFSFNGANTKFYAFDTGIESQALASLDNYGWEQVAWFANALLSDDSEHIAITAHILYYNYDASDLSQGIQPLMDYVLRIAQAYNNRTSITVNGTTYDYSSRTGKVEFCIGGHTHADATGTLYGIPFVLTLNVRNNVSLGASFDLVFVDYDSNKIELVRVGAGEDRTVNLA